jgi:hypothetical protein
MSPVGVAHLVESEERSDAAQGRIVDTLSSSELRTG